MRPLSEFGTEFGEGLHAAPSSRSSIRVYLTTFHATKFDVMG